MQKRRFIMALMTYRYEQLSSTDVLFLKQLFKVFGEAFGERSACLWTRRSPFGYTTQ